MVKADTEQKILNFKDLLDDDIKNINSVKTAIVKLNVLSEKLGRDVYVKVTGLKNRDYINASKGVDTDTSEGSYNGSLLLAVRGVVEPDLKDKETQERFGVSTSKELAERLFQGDDISTVVNEISYLSGLTDENGNARDVKGEAKN